MKKLLILGAGTAGTMVANRLHRLVDGGAKLYACRMSVDLNGLKKDDFVDGVQDIVTAGDSMDMSEGAQIIFI